MLRKTKKQNPNEYSLLLTGKKYANCIIDVNNEPG